jgi:hypothetical protein
LPGLAKLSVGGLSGSPDAYQNVLSKDHEANAAQRNDRFVKWVKQTGPLPLRHFDRDRILDFNKTIRSADPSEDITDIETERKNYVKSLFRAGKK